VLGWFFWGLWYQLVVHDSSLRATESMLPGLQGTPFYEPFRQAAENLPTKAEVWSRVLLSPLLTPVLLFVGSFLVHLALVLLGGGERGYRVSFRAICYGITPFLLLALPFCGLYLAWFWSVILVGVALARGHRCAGWQAAFAVIVTVLFTCCFSVGMDLLLQLGTGQGG
jgi:hypothetical protein